MSRRSIISMCRNVYRWALLCDRTVSFPKPTARFCPVSPHFLTRWVSRLLKLALVSWATVRVSVHCIFPFAFHISVFFLFTVLHLPLDFIRFLLYDRCICTRAWPIHRQHSPSGPIVGQSEPSENDDNRWPVRADVSRWCETSARWCVTHWIHLAMGSIGHLCRTIQGSARHLSLMTVQELREVSICVEARPCSTVQTLSGVSDLSSCSSITLLDQQSLSQAWIACGN